MKGEKPDAHLKRFRRDILINPLSITDLKNKSETSKH